MLRPAGNNGFCNGSNHSSRPESSQYVVQPTAEYSHDVFNHNPTSHHSNVPLHLSNVFSTTAMHSPGNIVFNEARAQEIIRQGSTEQEQSIHMLRIASSNEVLVCNQSLAMTQALQESQHQLITFSNQLDDLRDHTNTKAL